MLSLWKRNLRGNKKEKKGKKKLEFWLLSLHAFIFLSLWLIVWWCIATFHYFLLVTICYLWLFSPLLHLLPYLSCYCSFIHYIWQMAFSILQSWWIFLENFGSTIHSKCIWSNRNMCSKTLYAFSSILFVLLTWFYPAIGFSVLPLHPILFLSHIWFRSWKIIPTLQVANIISWGCWVGLGPWIVLPCIIWVGMRIFHLSILFSSDSICILHWLITLF